MANDIGWGEGACNNDIGWGLAQEYFSCSGAAEAPVGATLIKTGQTTSYRTGDDGDLEAGRATDFTTLASNNPFGNTNRFTDELGGATYTNNIVIDWSTYDGSTVLGVKRTISGGSITWDAAIDACLTISIGTFTTGWRLANFKEITNLMSHATGLTSSLNYSPLNIGAAVLWSSSTRPNLTTYANQLITHQWGFAVGQKTTGSDYLAVRTFTVTGTTLT
jgi:hypothetical protein